jgi:hypothetical protein
MQFLSEEWLEACCGADRPNLAGATGVIVLKTEGGPDGKTIHRFTLDEGVIVDASVGKAKGADIELIAPWPLAQALLKDGADPATEYMRGKLKMSGDMEMWLAVLPVLSSPPAMESRSALGERTTF